MDRQPVSSSNIKAIGYDPKTKTLEVEFHNGTAHAYENVPAATHAKLLKAKSIGSYFHVHVRNFHKSKPIA